MASPNKTITIVGGIEALIAKECGELTMVSEGDRAKMAWWVFQNFVEDNKTVRDIVERRDGKTVLLKEDKK